MPGGSHKQGMMLGTGKGKMEIGSGWLDGGSS